MSSIDSPDRGRRYGWLVNNKPGPGTILKPKSGLSVFVFVDRDIKIRGKEKSIQINTMFCNAAVDSEATGWFLTDEAGGLKCLILPRSQEKLLAKVGGDVDKIKVLSLRVVRSTLNGRALLCETVE